MWARWGSLSRGKLGVGLDFPQPALLEQVLTALAQAQAARGHSRVSPAALAADLADLIASLSAVPARGQHDKRWMKELAKELEQLLKQGDPGDR